MNEVLDITQSLKAKIVENLSEILVLKSQLKERDQKTYDTFKTLYLSLIEIIDAYETKEVSMREKYGDSDDALKAINGFSIVKRKVISLLGSFGVTRIEFPENKLIIGFCKVVGTEPNSAMKNDNIISVVRNGYVKGHDVIREAELIVVKN